MSNFTKHVLIGITLGLSGMPVNATNLAIKPMGSDPISKKTVRFQCDQKAADLGLPAGPFSVEYLNVGGNNLAILPIKGRSLIFACVSSGSGARYESRQYIWWDAGGRGVTLYSDSLKGKGQTACKQQKSND